MVTHFSEKRAREGASYLDAKLAGYNLRLQNAKGLGRLSNIEEIKEKLNRLSACLDNTLTALEVDG